MAGALNGVTIIELAGIGPGPFAGMMLADQGARVIRVVRPGFTAAGNFGKYDILNRNRETIELDLKNPDDLDRLFELVENADGLFEGNRPGVMERLGIAPDVLLGRNPGLVIGRMTGWGQDGPLASSAGHDINYIALSGALHTYGRAGQKPTAPLNVVGDYGGGGMLLAFGMLAGIISARATGKGQVIDSSMLDGAAILSASTYMMLASGLMRDERGVNMIDSGSPYYDTYETADGKFVSVGPLEEEFYDLLLEKIGVADDSLFGQRDDREKWPELKARLEQVFLTKTRDEWCEVLEYSDACFAPVLSLSEAPRHPHNVARGTFIEIDGVVQPAPAPRFQGTPAPPVRMNKS